jgi:2-methylisocitrate lyase-like PEP mutase family enzyme
VTLRGWSSRTPVQRRAALRARLQSPGLVVAPGVHDMVSARIADKQGFDALYMTGYGAVASYLGYPDAGIASASDMLDRVAQFATITDTPMVCDGDTGYGGLLNVMHTVRSYEAAGACAIQLEDQEAPKKCGHMLGRRVIPAQEMADKIRVAADTRTDPNFLIIGRTDARTSHGLDEALRRAELYARAGADLLFIEGPESEQEMETIGHAFDLPLVVNMVPGGRTPILPFAQLEQLGFRMALCPVASLLAAAQASESVYTALRSGGSPVVDSVPAYDFKAFSPLMGFDWIAEFDRKYKQE